MTLPKINIDEYPDHRDILERVVLKNGHIRKSRPPFKKDDEAQGMAYYVWRNLMFYVSQMGEHQCLPMTADFELPGKFGSDEHKQVKTKLDEMVDLVMKSIPRNQWYGARRWAGVL